MTRYLKSYLLWLSFVLAAAALAAAWYRHVEEIGRNELADRLKNAVPGRDTEDTEDTDASD